MTKKRDLHIHTCYSDGACTPEEIVKKYKDGGYDEISVTDHDTLEGIGDVMAAAKCAGLKVVPGIEMATANAEGIEMHILGYGMDTENEELNKRLLVMSAAREERNEALISYLAAHGCPLTHEDLMIGKRGHYIGKPDFGRALVRKGYLAKLTDAFKPDSILNTEEARAIKKVFTLTEESISLINGAGGTPVLAHPIKIRGIGEPGSEEFYANFEKLLIHLIDSGLKGIECYHPSHSIEQAERFLALAKKYSLIVTEGSDYHGDDM